jgi:hypothetical protein
MTWASKLKLDWNRSVRVKDHYKWETSIVFYGMNQSLE